MTLSRTGAKLECPRIASVVWAAKYRHSEPFGPAEGTIEDTFRRVAAELASLEQDRARWRGEFFRLLRERKFIPGGRILAGAGAGGEVTLLNCFVLPIDDVTFDSSLANGLATMRAGGGVGYDLAQCRPRGPGAPGVVARMHAIDRKCAALRTEGARRGALMATLRCDHPDIERFAAAKLRPGALPNFNLSVLISDSFLEAVDADQCWTLGSPGGVAARSVSARQLWLHILRCAYESAEPGVLFVDRINRLNNLGYCEQISATNPCGEVPLPPFGACDLGSLNLPLFVRNPFEPGAVLDEAALERAVPVAVRFLDNVIDLSRYPLREQWEVARSTRRIGLGIMGLADALMMLGLRYGSDGARAVSERLIRAICHAAYRASVKLAEQRGSFPALDRNHYLARPFVAALPSSLRDAILHKGIRNSHLIAIAPTGSISLLAGAVSSGMEPVFGADYQREVTGPDGSRQSVDIEDYAVALWRRAKGTKALPRAFVSAGEISAEDQLAMQACLQRHVDNAISKTVAMPADLGFDRFRTVYGHAFDLGLKGCAAYRRTPVRGSVMRIAREDCASGGRGAPGKPRSAVPAGTHPYLS